MRDAAVAARVEDREVPLQARLDVVGVQNGVPRRLGHAITPEHLHVGVGNQQDAGAAPRRRRHGVDGAGAAGLHDRVARQIGCEMRRDANRSHAGPAAAVRNAERLVQIDVAHVGANRGRTGEADLRVHVRAVHVHLAAAPVHRRTDVLNCLLEHAVRGRIRDHQRSQAVGVRVGLASQVIDIDVAVGCTRHHHDAHARHHRARRVGAMRRGRNENHIAPGVAAIAMVGSNHHQPGELALGAGIRLQRHGREAGDLAQGCFDLSEDLAIPFCLIDGDERMQVRELGPCDWQHL